jgi:hypothetical protein
MHENPYQAPKIEATIEKSSRGKPLPPPVAIVLAAFSVMAATCFFLMAVSCFFDATWSRFEAPWNLDGDVEAAGMTVLFWSAIGFSTWVATAWAALRARKAVVAAALIVDAAVFVSIALL